MGHLVATLGLFLAGVLSLLLFHPTTTAYLYAEPLLRWKFVTLFTHMLSHSSWSHLLGNYLFGAPYMIYLEYRLKSAKKFIRLFFWTGFVAFLCQYVANELSLFKSSGLIGSSGAIFGLVGASLMCYRGPRAAEITAKAILIFHIASQAEAAYASLVFPMGVAYAAHLGGLLSGAWFSYRHLRRGPNHFRKLRRALRRFLPKR